MTTTENLNFQQRVYAYYHDNFRYIKEVIETPTADDVLEHWDTNGSEGIGEELTEEQREIFLNCVNRFFRDGDSYSGQEAETKELTTKIADQISMEAGEKLNACSGQSVAQDCEPIVQKYVEEGYGEAEIRNVLVNSIEDYEA